MSSFIIPVNKQGCQCYAWIWLCSHQFSITPVPTKPGLDPVVPRNYRPIYNLHFLGKILEITVGAHFKGHITSNDMFDVLQFILQSIGFRQNHGTETAIVKAINYMLAALVRGVAVYAFDTVCHNILLHRLEKKMVGLTATDLSWFRSYLSDRQKMF